MALCNGPNKASQKRRHTNTYEAVHIPHQCVIAAAAPTDELCVALSMWCNITILIIIIITLIIIEGLPNW